MKLATSRAELDAARAAGRPGGRVGLVPTMGALHRGHEALLAAARDDSDLVVASIFVNPLQFGPQEDLAAYPRTLDADLERCEANGVDVVFAPDVETMYPGGDPQVTVAPGPLGDQLEGASRPGHFRGVLTVVVKLFGLVRPDCAVFGTKDYQQLTLVRRCVTDLCLPVQIVGVETVRAPDGLALSSRNRYLDPAQRLAAASLSRALRSGQTAGSRGQRAVLEAAETVLAADPKIQADYLELRAPDLGPAPRTGPARLLVAARVGRTRLIDNVPVALAATAPSPTPGGS